MLKKLAIAFLITFVLIINIIGNLNMQNTNNLYKYYNIKFARQEFIKNLLQYEGFMPKWYNDAGKQSIGYGIQKNPENLAIFKKLGIDPNQGITKEQALQVLNTRLDTYEYPALRKQYPNFDKFPVGVQRALLDGMYNMGTNAYKGWVGMNGHLASGRYGDAAREFYDSHRSLTVHSPRARWGAEQMSGDSDLFNKANAPKISLAKIESYKKKYPNKKIDQFFLDQHKQQPVVTSDLVVTQPQVTPTTYKIRKGDTLSAIAKRYKLDLSKLQQFNKIKDPNKINIGQTINIPAL